MKAFTEICRRLLQQGCAFSACKASGYITPGNAICFSTLLGAIVLGTRHMILRASITACQIINILLGGMGLSAQKIRFFMALVRMTFESRCSLLHIRGELEIYSFGNTLSVVNLFQRVRKLNACCSFGSKEKFQQRLVRSQRACGNAERKDTAKHCKLK